MPTPILPCKICRILVPRFDLDRSTFEVVVRALSNGSKTLATAEFRSAVQCDDAQARNWIDHLLSCAGAWPHSEQDEIVLRRIEQAFAEVHKPEHFTNYTHCDECKEHDDTLRGRTRENLRRQDLGNGGWDPLCFSSAEGIGYYFPTLARFALLPDAWRDHGWYGSQLLSHLAHDAGSNRFLAWCSSEQCNAIHAFLQHMLRTRLEPVTSHGNEDELRGALSAWAPPK